MEDPIKVGVELSLQIWRLLADLKYLEVEDILDSIDVTQVHPHTVLGVLGNTLKHKELFLGSYENLLGRLIIALDTEWNWSKERIQDAIEGL